jgi:hypothetical protein
METLRVFACDGFKKHNHALARQQLKATRHALYVFKKREQKLEAYLGIKKKKIDGVERVMEKEEEMLIDM